MDKNCPDVPQRLWFGETSTEPLEQLIVTMTEVKSGQRSGHDGVETNNCHQVRGHVTMVKIVVFLL